MDKNFLIIIVIVGVLVLLAAGYLIWQRALFVPTVPIPPKIELPGVVQEEGAAPEELPAQEFTVIGSEFIFSPKVITVKAGQPVRITFVNSGKLSHNFTIPDLGVGTRTISPGQQETIQFTVSERGLLSVAAICSVPGHQEAGMVGTLRVE